jgi:predicted P-loop ATPase/GTPase
VPYACTIQSVELVADQSGSIVIDVWRDSYQNFPPVAGDSIAGSAKPTLSSAQKSQNTTLSGWTTTLTEGQYLAFNVDSASTVTRVVLTLKVQKDA